jgi:hypothetical protein
VFITIRDFSLHGGIRIILECANRLAASGHVVFLRPLRLCPRPAWFIIDPRVNIVTGDGYLCRCDLLIVTAPDAANYLNATQARRVSTTAPTLFQTQPRPSHTTSTIVAIAVRRLFSMWAIPSRFIASLPHSISLGMVRVIWSRMMLQTIRSTLPAVAAPGRISSWNRVSRG